MPLNGRSDRNAMRLWPGEVGLRGDRATFHIGPTPTARATGGWRPTGRDLAAGAVYYHMTSDVAEKREAEKRAAKKLEAEKRRTAKLNAKTLRVGHYGGDDDDDDYDNNKDNGGDDKVDGGDVDDDLDDEPDWRPKNHVMQMLPALPASKGVAVGPVTGLPVGSDEHVFTMWLDKRDDEPDEKARLQIEVRLPKDRGSVIANAGTQCVEEPEKPKAKDTKKNKKNKKKAAGGGKKKTGVEKKNAAAK